MWCDCCGQRIRFGQSRLTATEKAQFNWGGAEDDVNIIKAQCIKAIADYYEIRNWTDEWDPQLSIRENAAEFQKMSEPEMRQIKR